jgi:hypothetical protein
MADKFKKKLTITGQEQLATFTKDGEEQVIYKVSAVSEAGVLVDPEKFPLRTFEENLPQGELIEFDVTKFVSEKYGVSFTLKSPNKGRASKKDISTMQGQLTQLANRVSALEGELGELKAKVNREKGLDEKYGGDDDIPF